MSPLLIFIGQIEETKIIEKEAGNIFAMQDAVAGEVGNLLLARFAIASTSPAANSERRMKKRIGSICEAGI